MKTVDRRATHEVLEGLQAQADYLEKLYPDNTGAIARAIATMRWAAGYLDELERFARAAEADLAYYSGDTESQVE